MFGGFANPKALKSIPHHGARLYGVGRPARWPRDWPSGARRATPYGRGCAKRFAAAAAERGVAIISGARGGDAVAHEAAPDAAGAPTVAFLGAAATSRTRAENAGPSSASWRQAARWFRARMGLPAPAPHLPRPQPALGPPGHAHRGGGAASGTFHGRRAASRAGRYGWCRGHHLCGVEGANRLLYQGALPLWTTKLSPTRSSTFGCLKEQRAEAADDRGKASQPYRGEEALLAALQAEPLGMEALRQLAEDHAPAGDTFTWLMIWLAEAQRDGLIAQYPDGRYGPHPALRTAV